MPGLRHAARPGQRGAAGPARARLHRAADRELQVEGPGQAARWWPSSATACSPCRATRATTSFGDVLVYVVPALGILLAAGGIAFAVMRWRRRGGGPEAAAAGHLPAPTARGSTTTWSATTCDRRRSRVDATIFAAFARRLHLVRLALRAAARARLPVDDLGRLVRRHPGGPRARARCSGPALLFCLAFTAMFVALGMTATGLGQTLQDHRARAAPDLRRRDRRCWACCSSPRCSCRS